MSSSTASKKHTDARTSQQVAAPVQDLDTPAPIPEPSVLETSGTLSHPYSLPIGEPAVPSGTSRIPRLVASAKELGRKWGIPDLDQLSDSGGDQRMTRTRTKLARAGAFTPAPDDLVYRGHDGTRIKNSRKVKQTEAETLTSDGEPAAPCAGAPVVQTSLPDGEPAASSTGAPIGTMHSDGEPFASSDGAPVVENSQVHGEPAAPNAGAPVEETSRSEAETVAQAASSRPDEQGSPIQDGWKLAVAGPSTQLSSPRVLTIATKYFPEWFDSGEDGDEDPYGSIPRGWLVSSNSSPVLPDIKIESSLTNDFWSEVDSSDEERDLQRAIRASISTAVEEREKREQRNNGLSAMAMLVEVDSDDKERETPATVKIDSDHEVPEVPAGQDGRFSSKQKGKEVPRTKDQRKFLREYVSGARLKRDKAKPDPSPGKGKGKAPQGPAQFKREPSMVPDGGWFRESTSAGGRGPPQGPPSSSSSSDPDSSSSDSSSDKGY